MKTPDEIKKGLSLYTPEEVKAILQQKWTIHLQEKLYRSAFVYIQQLEAQNAGLLEKVEQLERQSERYRQSAIQCCYESRCNKEIKELESLCHRLMNEKEQLKAEWDAAVNELVGTCQVCRWEETEKCASCHFNVDAWNVHESNWQWRGVQKEE